MNKNLLGIYGILFEKFGEQHWWPAETEFEVIVGAILTQASAWKNAEIAIERLKSEKILNPAGIKKVEQNRLKKLIRSAGYYNAKSRKLKEFVNFLYKHYNGDLNLLLKQPKDKLRKELLSIWGIGYETADSIILYAAHKPSFVVDAYTRRIFSRFGIINDGIGYENLKKFFEDNLPENLEIYNELHALIVELGKNYCMTKPICGECPLAHTCKFNHGRDDK